MFTGIIEELGRVRSIEKRGEDARVVIEARTVTEGSHNGDSISVNGVCLTALDITEDSFAADVSKETLFRSTLGNLTEGSPVNLERAVTPATRLGGHIVQGHVDARGKFLGAEDHGESWTFRFAYPKEIGRYLVFKGSVAVEGISLTISNLSDDYFEIAVIPKTFEVTNFSQLEPGDKVNLEVDVIAKYVERILTVPRSESEESVEKDPNPPLLRAAFFFGIIIAAIGLNWYLFKLFHVRYFLWYLQKGPLISIAAAFIGPTLTSLKARFGLISTNPAIYAGACLQVLGVFISSLSPSHTSATVRRKASGTSIRLNSPFARVFDNVLYVPLVLVMAVLSLAWVATVAPMAYLVTLVAGVPARQALRGKVSTTYVGEEGGQVAIGGSSDVSFARDPFVITQAVSTLLLFLAGMIYSRIG
jgi:riboflavin synthase